MGGSESTGRRKVSFGLDEEDRVRVLSGVRLTDDLLSRMKEPSAQRGEPNSSPTSDHPSSPQPSLPRGGPAPSASEFRAETESAPGPSAGESKQMPTYAEDELYRRYEREQAIIQEELARIAQREHEASNERYSSAILREKNYTNQERRRAEQLAKELKRKEEELKNLDSFHKEQLNSIEKKNLEIYRLTAEQFHTAATNAELRVNSHIGSDFTRESMVQRKRPPLSFETGSGHPSLKRSYDPVCLNLQSNILKCYSENQQERLNCSDLAKEYRNCVREAQKNLLFNHN